MNSPKGLLVVLHLALVSVALGLTAPRGATDGPVGVSRSLTSQPPSPASAAGGAAGASLPLLPHRFGEGPLHLVRVDSTDTETLARIDASGGLTRRFDYGSFQWIELDERAWPSHAALAAEGFDFRDEAGELAFNGIVLRGDDPRPTIEALDAAERFTDPSAMALDPASGLYVVQFAAPPKDEWVAALDRLGTTFRQYVPMFGYVVQVAPERVRELEAWAASVPYVRFTGNYEPAFRTHPYLRAMVHEGVVNEPQLVTIQLVNTRDVRRAIDEIRGLADEVVQAYRVGPYVNVQARLHPSWIQAVAATENVFQIEPLGERVRLDERQGQILAGNTTSTGPSAPGYLSWLQSKGFSSSQFGSFSVNVVDDAYSLTGHPDLPSGRIDFQNNPTSQGGAQGGHGFLNANIVAGFNNGSGSAVEDSSGYNYGLGIAPWAHVGATAIFGNGSSNPTSWESAAYGQGARISTNSWGFSSFGSPIADYDSNAQEYDFIVRDAQGGAGNQELMVIFAAGNDGSASNTVSTPGTAKNVLTVGASENNRQTGTDGCGIGNSGANNYNDLASFSSHGPVNSSGGDGRWKPEICAPGTHIEAGVPQSNYNGSSVCNQYWPSGQTLYGWSSGTSHSTPALAGAAALVRQYFLNQGMGAPSPAMNKAYLVNTGRYMTGSLANDTLPSNAQGMGNVDLGRAFDGVPRVYVDQTVVLGASGASHVVSGNVADGAQPFRVTLVWTDAPGPTSGAPYVNDLDLTVDVGGQTYRGNVFSGATSTTGGSSDTRNNTESVFLPAGVTGPFTVTVTAATIGGDGVPGNGDSTDQDFALVVYNGTSGPVGPTANFTASPTSGNYPLAVQFTDLSTGNPTSWSWNFGDGSTSTLQNPSHTYTAAGSYSVTLSIVTPTGNDTLTKTNYITVSAPPPPGISDGSFESQTAGSPPASPWTIDFGAGHVINPAGGATSDGGMPTDGTNWLEISAQDTNNATPPSNPGGVTNPPSGGAGVSQTFSYGAGQTLLEFDAAFLRNETANSTYNDWMSVDISDGSTWYNLYYADTSTATVGTSSKHGFAMTAVSHVQADLATLFPSSTTSTTFTLTVQVGNGTDGIQPSVGYADHFVLTGTGPVPPTADFTGSPTSGAAPLAVAFTDASTGDVTSWSWDFGDGATSTLQNPSHTYATPGTYTVSLTATGPAGSDTLVRTNYITVSEPPPVADFTGTPTSGTAPLAVSFTDSSTGSITSWSWDFGDGATSTLQSPSHTYTAAGTYTVSLTVSGPGGSDTLTRPAYITVDPPVATAKYYLSFQTTTAVPGLGNVRDEDIVTYDPSTGTWAWYFDGSDVGLGSTDINAFHVRADGSILLSLNSSSYSVPGLVGGPNGPTIEDSDVILFTFSGTPGANTSGSFTFYLDGSDIGLTENGEDIDGLYEFADGSLGISTLGSASFGGASGIRDEDVVRFYGSFGASTSGTAALWFDGSDVGFAASSGHDIDALSFENDVDMLFSTQGSYNAAGGAGADEDLSRFSGTFGPSTSGTATLVLDLSTLGIDPSADVDGLTFR